MTINQKRPLGHVVRHIAYVASGRFRSLESDVDAARLKLEGMRESFDLFKSNFDDLRGNLALWRRSKEDDMQAQSRLIGNFQTELSGLRGDIKAVKEEQAEVKRLLILLCESRGIPTEKPEAENAFDNRPTVKILGSR